LWHPGYGNLNVKGLKLLVEKNMVVGLLKIGGLEFCEGCVYGEQTRNLFPINKAWRFSKSLELVHVDVCGPISVESVGGSRYFLLFANGYSRISWVYFLKFKLETFVNFKQFKALVEKQSWCSIMTLHSNRGGEFTANGFVVFCEKKTSTGSLHRLEHMNKMEWLSKKIKLWLKCPKVRLMQ